jgi:hypothetical protein
MQRQVARLHILDHALAQRRHWLGHGETPVVGLQHAILTGSPTVRGFPAMLRKRSVSREQPFHKLRRADAR